MNTKNTGQENQDLEKKNSPAASATKRDQKDYSPLDTKEQEPYGVKTEEKTEDARQEQAGDSMQGGSGGQGASRNKEGVGWNDTEEDQ